MYAKKAGMNLRGQNVLAEGRIRAELKAGKLLKDMDKAKEKRTDLVPRGNQVGKSTLAGMGVTKKETAPG